MAGVSIIIPARNEQATIGKTVKIARQALPHAEVIVSDSGSQDETAKKARQAGARVVRSRKGKGNAMADGLAASSGGTIVFFDADIKNATPRMLRKLAAPVTRGKAAAAVGVFESPYPQIFTNTVYWPLANTFFPEARRIAPLSPLSGQRAMTRKLALRYPFRNDFGIEAALNLDWAANGVTPMQVRLGKINPVFKGNLGSKEMRLRARQIAAAVVDKAREYGRLDKATLASIANAASAVATLKTKRRV
ncbi:MAG: glycosyltransferase [Candidatus Micrarchaeota archaeon]